MKIKRLPFVGIVERGRFRQFARGPRRSAGIDRPPIERMIVAYPARHQGDRP